MSVSGHFVLPLSPSRFRFYRGDNYLDPEGNPFGDALYLFINRRRDKLKALYWHRNGFCLWYKRLEAERFAWPAAEASQATTSVLTIKELEWLLEGFDLWATKPHKTLHYQSVT